MQLELSWQEGHLEGRQNHVAGSATCRKNEKPQCMTKATKYT